MNKLRIRRSFTRALPTYASQASVQQHMAETLLHQVVETQGTSFGRILEIGCGAGTLTQRLIPRLTFHALILNDLVAESYPALSLPAGLPVHFVGGDAEQIRTLPRDLDLIISNATWQWFSDPLAAVQRMARRLKPGGCLAFSTFGPDNFREFTALLGGLTYLPAERFREACPPWLDNVVGAEDRCILYFSDFPALLRHVRELGANTVCDRTWSRSSLRDLAERYTAQFATSQGLPLTYHPLYFVLRRTPQAAEGAAHECVVYHRD